MRSARLLPSSSLLLFNFKMASKRSAVSFECDSGSNKKKQKRQQVFLDKYRETWPFVRRGKSDMHAFCEICACDLGIGSGGRDDIRRHVDNEKHKKNVKIRDSQKANAKLTQYFGGASSSSSDKTDLAVMRAETMMVDVAVELNLSMNSLDTLNKAVKIMFPDSKIAQKYQCGRTKATAVVKEMAAQTTLMLGKRMQQQPFTISTDGSNDRRAEKLFPLVVRTVDQNTMEVRSDVLAVPALQGAATGENIFNLINNEFSAHNVPWENCLSLGCDNANVMVGAEKGVYGLMKKKNPNLYLSGCVCHLIHISAQKGASCLPFDVGQLLIEIYYYLDKSSKRYSAFKCMQVLHNLQEAKFIKHVSTRWLSIGKCLPRLISNWDALLHFFKDEEEATSDSTNKSKAGKIRSKLQSATFKACAMFLLDAIQPFDDINTKLQSDEPQIHVLRDILHNFFRTLLLKFVKPSALQYKLVTEVDFKSTCNLKQKSDLIIGDKARQFMQDHNNKLREERIEEFYTAVQNFYKVSCDYIKKKLPLTDELLKHAEVANPKKQQYSHFSSLEYFLTRFPKVLHPEATVSTLQLEFSKYQSSDIRSCISGSSRVDATWREISKLTEVGEAEFQYLPTVMLNILTIPHSSAHCERIFTGVRKTQTDFRGSMGGDTLEALLVAKGRPGSALERSYSDDQLRDLKSANYRHRLSQE